jgi:isopentenyldiphosphate isomerase
MVEIIDIVNEHDVVIDQAPRHTVHEQNLMHRAAHVLLMHPEHGVFLQLRSKTKDTNPGLWDSSAAGHVDAGETYLDCASRELFEELGVSMSPEHLQEVGRMSPAADNGYEFIRIYKAVSREPITLQASEIEDGKWLQAAELNDVLAEQADQFTHTFCDIWRMCNAHFES